MKNFRKIRTGNYQLDQIQENVSQVFNPLKDVAILNGILHKDITINTTFALEHKLNRTPKGYIIVEQDSNSTIYLDSKTSNYLNLVSSANVTCNIWVF